jgi:hypothetical protein
MHDPNEDDMHLQQAPGATKKNELDSRVFSFFFVIFQKCLIIDDDSLTPWQDFPGTGFDTPCHQALIDQCPPRSKQSPEIAAARQVGDDDVFLPVFSMPQG